MSTLIQHRPPYFVSGEDGTPLSSQRISLEAIGAENGTLRYASQEADTLTWTQRDGIVLDWGQQINVFDSTGKRIYVGWVTQRRPTWTPAGTMWSMAASNAWYFLDRILLSGESSSSDGSTQERPSYLFAQDRIETTIRILLNRAIAAGIPMAIGDIAPAFEFIQMMFNNQSYSRTLMDILSILPDAGIRWDYDVSGLPKINITRRDTAPHVILQLGTDPDDTRKIVLNERRELVATTVVLQGITINSKGGVDLTEDKATAKNDALIPNNGLFGQLSRQMISFAGPGTAKWTAPDIRKVRLRTIPLTSLSAIFNALHPGLKDTGAYYSYLGTTLSTYTGTSNGFTISSWPPKSGVYIDDDSGQTAVASLKGNVVVAGELPEWWEETGHTRQKIRMIARFYAVTNTAIGRTTCGSISSFQMDLGSSTLFIADLELEAIDIDASYPSLTTVIHPRDLPWLNPPSGLAENLLKTQSWLPLEGSITLGPDAPAVPAAGGVISARNGDSRWTNAAALVQAASFDLAAGQTALSIGAPVFASPQGLIERYKRIVQGSVVDVR